MTGEQPELRWLVSHWDHHQHGFRVLGEIASAAICTHSALTSKLTEPGNEPYCLACRMLHGEELAARHARHGDRDLWAM